MQLLAKIKNKEGCGQVKNIYLFAMAKPGTP